MENRDHGLLAKATKIREQIQQDAHTLEQDDIGIDLGNLDLDLDVESDLAELGLDEPEGEDLFGDISLDAPEPENVSDVLDLEEPKPEIPDEDIFEGLELTEESLDITEEDLKPVEKSIDDIFDDIKPPEDLSLPEDDGWDFEEPDIEQVIQERKEQKSEIVYEKENKNTRSVKKKKKSEKSVKLKIGPFIKYSILLIVVSVYSSVVTTLLALIIKAVFN
jgi:hypothetical protein